jgi:hypothetical protein
VAFPCLFVEVVGEVISEYYSGVVEFESRAVYTQPTWFIQLGSYALEVPANNRMLIPHNRL